MRLAPRAGKRQRGAVFMPEPHPTITLVTANYNLAPFLEATLRSVLDQAYPALEYVVVDGGSTDGSLEIIRRHASRLTRWSSGSDRNMYHAINKGFAGTSGEIMGWLNGDDLHLPWTLSTVADIFQQCPEVEWITSLYPLVMNAKGQVESTHYLAGFNRETFLRGVNLPQVGFHARGYIQQESTFWRRSLWERAGGRLSEAHGTAGDFELWTRFIALAPLHGVAVPLAGFRAREGQLSQAGRAAYEENAERALTQAGGRRVNGMTNTLRRKTAALFGQRPLARRMPVLLRKGLLACGLLSRAPVIRNVKGRWCIHQEFVV